MPMTHPCWCVGRYTEDLAKWQNAVEVCQSADPDMWAILKTTSPAPKRKCTEQSGNRAKRQRAADGSYQVVIDNDSSDDDDDDNVPLTLAVANSNAHNTRFDQQTQEAHTALTQQVNASGDSREAARLVSTLNRQANTHIKASRLYREDGDLAVGHRNSLFHLFFDPKYTGTNWFVGADDAINISLITTHIDAVIREIIPNVYTQAMSDHAMNTRTIKTSEYADSGIAAAIDFGIVRENWTKRSAEQPVTTWGFKIVLKMRFALSDTYTTDDYIKAEAFHPKLNQACRNAAASLIKGISAICTTPKQTVIMSHCAVKIVDDLKSHNLVVYNNMFTTIRDLEVKVSQAAIASGDAQDAVEIIIEDRHSEDIAKSTRAVAESSGIDLTEETTDRVIKAIEASRDAINTATTTDDIETAWLTHESHLNDQDSFGKAYKFAARLANLDKLKEAKVMSIEAEEQERRANEALKQQQAILTEAAAKRRRQSGRPTKAPARFGQ